MPVSYTHLDVYKRQISAGLDPMTDALAMEDGTSAYVNILVCKDGNQEEPKIKALAAALQLSLIHI